MSMSQRSSAASAQRRPYDSTPFLSHARSGDSALETDATAWLEGRRERLHDRLREVRAKLAAGRLEGVRLENSRLKITPYDPLTPPAGERLDRALDALMPRIRIHRPAVGCERPNGVPRRVYRSALRARPLQSDGAPRRDSRRCDQPRTRAHGARVEGREPCAAVVGQRLVSAFRNLRRRLGADHRCPPRTAVLNRVGQRQQDIVGRAVLCVGTQRRGDQREIRTGPGPQDLLLPVGALRLVPFQRDRGHRRRGAVRARRAGGKRSPIRPPCAPCRHWRRLRPRLRPVPPARSLVRASSAQLSRPPAGVLRQTWAVEGTRPPHGQADQRGGRARALERRPCG